MALLAIYNEQVVLVEGKLDTADLNTAHIQPILIIAERDDGQT